MYTNAWTSQAQNKKSDLNRVNNYFPHFTVICSDDKSSIKKSGFKNYWKAASWPAFLLK